MPRLNTLMKTVSFYPEYPFTRYNRLSNRLNVCLHYVAGCSTDCSTGLTTGCIVQTWLNGFIEAVYWKVDMCAFSLLARLVVKRRFPESKPLLTYAMTLILTLTYLLKTVTSFPQTKIFCHGAYRVVSTDFQWKVTEGTREIPKQRQSANLITAKLLLSERKIPVRHN